MGKDYQDTSENEVAEVRSRMETGDRMDARKAIEEAVRLLTTGQAYYTWTPVGDQGTFLLRVPKEEKMSEAWLRDEYPALIHICQPIQFIKAYHNNEKNKVPNFCGYVREDACTRCKRAPEDDTIRRAEAHIRLFKLNQKLNG